jgi:hypothetical protein
MADGENPETDLLADNKARRKATFKSVCEKLFVAERSGYVSDDMRDDFRRLGCC